MGYTEDFFEVIDKAIDHHAFAIRNKVFSLYRDLPWTREQYRQLQPAVHEELVAFVGYILGIFNNVGCTRVPENVIGYRIKVIPIIRKENGSIETRDEVEIGDGYTDYIVLTLHFKNFIEPIER
jgi:hypothetical protein